MKYKHIKSGKTYIAIGVALNATNGKNNQIMVVYKDHSGTMYVRENKEFHEKFKPI